jgi:hypothetical protein
MLATTQRDWAIARFNVIFPGTFHAGWRIMRGSPGTAANDDRPINAVPGFIDNKEICIAARPVSNIEGRSFAVVSLSDFALPAGHLEHRLLALRRF